MDQNFENWELSPPLPDDVEELKKMRRSLRRRNGKTILTSILLVIVLLLGTLQFAIPAVEKLYWDPTVCTYLEDVPDLELTMSVYNELFGHGQLLMQTEIRKTGFASYSINAYFLEWESLNRLTSLSYRSASLEQNQWNADPNFWLDIQRGIILRDPSTLDDDLRTQHQQQVAERLQELPDYIQILASLTFSHDLSMKQFQIFTDQYSSQQANFIWAVLRTGEKATPACGIHLSEYNSSRYQPATWKDTPYPDLFPDRTNWSWKTMEQHVYSMLQFSAYQTGLGTGIVPSWTDSSYYQRVLAYMQENGVQTYGCYLIATPEVLLEMLESGAIAYLHLEEAWIGL